MKSQEQEERDKGQVLAQFEAMYDELYAWREDHPEASLDEIVAQVTPRRRELMGELLAQLALQHGNGAVPEVLCEKCGKPMEYKGNPKRGVINLEGGGDLKRAYYHCPDCERGFFPSGLDVEAAPA
jgi:hypothetical protein